MSNRVHLLCAHNVIHDNDKSAPDAVEQKTNLSQYYE